MAKSGSKQKKYSKKFKTAVIMDMRENHLGKRETVRKHWQTNSRQEEDLYVKTLKRWERIYMKEGAAGLMTERRGRKSTGRPRKKPLDKEIENDLIAENQRLKERNQYLEAELEYLKKIGCLSSSGRAKEWQKAIIIAELRQRFKLKQLLSYSMLPRSTFYNYVKASKTDKYIAEKQAIIELYEQHKQRYGYRRITALLRQNNIILNHKTVLKLMKSLNTRGKQRKNGQYHSYKGEVGKVAENILNRDFTASKPFEKLTTDVTQFKVCNDKVYLSPIMDLYNREIVSYSISLSPDLAQIREMLQGLTEKLPEGATPIFHSDQGWQYQHAEYQRYLKEHNTIQSMSRKGNCMDNGAMENFFGRLKVEMFYGENFETVDEFVHRLMEYIYYWNDERISLKLVNYFAVIFWGEYYVILTFPSRMC